MPTDEEINDLWINCGWRDAGIPLQEYAEYLLINRREALLHAEELNRKAAMTA